MLIYTVISQSLSHMIKVMLCWNWSFQEHFTKTIQEAQLPLRQCVMQM